MHPLLAEGWDFAFCLEAHKDPTIRHARDLRRQVADIIVLMCEQRIQKRQCKRGSLRCPVCIGQGYCTGDPLAFDLTFRRLRPDDCSPN